MPTSNPSPTSQDPVRICMWSGPRNISTAMMRAWSSRADCAVLDEPFYAHYLKATGAQHPDFQKIIDNHESDWRAVVKQCLGPVPGNKPLFFQKHMCHHMLPEIELGWLASCRHAMLLRDPKRMLISLQKVIGTPTLRDTGLPQQLHLFDAITNHTGTPPPMFDSTDILRDPPTALAAICHALRVPYTGDMLCWQPGPHPADGIWGPHWYANLYNTTGFAPYTDSHEELPPDLQPLLDECQEIYSQLTKHRIEIA